MFKKIKDFLTILKINTINNQHHRQSSSNSQSENSGLSGMRFEKMTNSNFPSLLHSLRRDSAKESENIVHLYL